MPTLPSTYATRRGTHTVVASIIADGEETLRDSPTPDPDLDDLELISVVTGDGLGAFISSSSLAASESRQQHSPRLNLTDLSLHSPSSIVGTPFDVSSPRYEYPFPTPDAVEYESTFGSSLYTSTTNTFVVAATHSPPSLSHPERAFQTTHPRYFLRDPPVPPTLAAKKRKSVAIPGTTHVPPPLVRRRTRSSTIAATRGDCDYSCNDMPNGTEEIKGPPQRRFASEEPSGGPLGPGVSAGRQRSNPRDAKADTRRAEGTPTPISRCSHSSRR